MSNRPRLLRRQLLFSLSVLLTTATVLGAIALSVALPLTETAGEAAVLVLGLTLVQVMALYLLSAIVIRRSLLDPVQRLVADVRRISDGDYAHRVELPRTRELRSIMEGVNSMADSLIEDQQELARNISSLEETNRELVEARNQVIQAARLASVGTLAAGIAHEVGNPLGAIIGYSDVAQRRLAGAGVDTELLSSIREEAQRIDRIVRGLLDYARPKTSELEPLHPARMLEQVRDLLELQGRLSRVDAVWHLSEEVPLVLMHAQHMEQVLVNLLLNAVQAVEGGKGGRIDVTLTSEAGPGSKVPARREGDHPSVNYLHRRRVAHDEDAEAVATLKTAERIVIISVADNGPGLTAETLEHIFDPFFTTKEPGKGTGLGLFISSRLVEGMGGRIDAANGPDSGALFSLRFPEALGVANPASPTPS